MSQGQGSGSKGKAPLSGSRDGMRVELDLVRALAALLDETNLSEIEVHDGERAIRVARQMAGGGPGAMAAPSLQASTAAATASATAAAADAPTAALADHPGLVRSPMVGTAYLSPEPGAAPFVSEGASVNKGDTLLIVEAMKVMNPITAPRAGKVRALLVGNEQPVEYDQPLAIVE